MIRLNAQENAYGESEFTQIYEKKKDEVHKIIVEKLNVLGPAYDAVVKDLVYESHSLKDLDSGLEKTFTGPLGKNVVEDLENAVSSVVGQA